MNDEHLQDDDAIDMIEAITSMPSLGRALHQQRVWAFVEGASGNLKPSAYQLLKVAVTVRPGATMLESQLARYPDRWRGLERDLLALSDCLGQWNANIAMADNIFSRPPKDLRVLTLEDLGRWLHSGLEIAAEQAACQEKEVAVTGNNILTAVSDIVTQAIKGVRLRVEELRRPREETLALALSNGHDELALGCWEVPLARVIDAAAPDAEDGAKLRIEVFNPNADRVADVLGSGGRLLFSVVLLPQVGATSNSAFLRLSIGNQSRCLMVNDTEPQQIVLNFMPNLPINLQLA